LIKKFPLKGRGKEATIEKRNQFKKLGTKFGFNVNCEDPKSENRYYFLVEPPSQWPNRSILKKPLSQDAYVSRTSGMNRERVLANPTELGIYLIIVVKCSSASLLEIYSSAAISDDGDVDVDVDGDGDGDDNDDGDGDGDDNDDDNYLDRDNSSAESEAELDSEVKNVAAVMLQEWKSLDAKFGKRPQEEKFEKKRSARVNLFIRFGWTMKVREQSENNRAKLLPLTHTHTPTPTPRSNKCRGREPKTPSNPLTRCFGPKGRST